MLRAPTSNPLDAVTSRSLSGRVLLASNRLPVTVKVDGDHVDLTPSSGGLATSMRHLHERGSTVWLGWPGDLGRASEGARAEVDRQFGEHRLLPVALSAAEIARYYDGFANGVLWPLFHYLTERTRRDPAADWRTYREVNERFAAALAEQYRPGDVVWVHDYHLLLVPGLLRRRIPDAVIGYFLHIPFPATEVFRILPWRDAILRGLLGADVVGFHTAEYANHFRAAAATLLGAEDTGDEVVFEDRRIRAGAYPIGIDVQSFTDAAALPEVAELTSRWRHNMLGRRIVLGIDRLDYTKGIVRRLLAIERLFERWPQWRERLHFLQLAVPTREKSDEYAPFRREVHELVGRINGRFGTPGWAPIHFLHRSVDHTELVALYRAADVMLVTPIRDGMNLVAKEYCACRTDDRGVLVLSEFAGAAAELRESLLINPYDIDSTASAVHRALMMNDKEQQVRMAALRATITAGDVHSWADRILGDVNASALASAAAEVGAGAPTDGSAVPAIVASARAAPRRLLLLDYDGTLVPFAPLPELAFPDDELRDLLDSLAGDPTNEVHVVSGRSRESLDAWFGDLPIGLHAEHGFWTRWPAQSWVGSLPPPTDSLRPLEAILSEVCRRTPGASIERKGSSMAWHYRMAEPILAGRRLDELRRRLAAALPPELEMLEGNKVLEIRLRGADKRAVVQRIIAARDRADTTILAIGDDRTDEDMFAAVPGSSLTIRVGGGATRARHRLDNHEDVRALLRALL